MGRKELLGWRAFRNLKHIPDRVKPMDPGGQTGWLSLLRDSNAGICGGSAGAKASELTNITQLVRSGWECRRRSWLGLKAAG